MALELEQLLDAPMPSLVRLADFLGVPRPPRRKSNSDGAYKYRLACAILRHLKRNPVDTTRLGG